MRRRLAAGAAVVALVALCLPLFDYRVDDAFISFRYARNLIAGRGLVYNPGERVEGYTDFAWILILAPLAWLGVMKLGAALIGVAASAASCVRVLRPGAVSPEALLPPLAVATSTPVVVYSTAGLETTLFMALVTFGWLALEREEAGDRFGASSALFLAAALTRPEGCLFFALAALYRGPATLASPAGRRWLAAFAVPGAIYFAFRWLYFGELLPATFHAKTGDLGQQAREGLGYLRQFAVEAAPLLVALLLLAPLACGAAAPRRRFFRFTLLALGGWTLYVVLIGGDWMRASRHFAPVVPLAAVVCGEGLALARRRFAWLGPRLAAAAVAALVAAQLAVLPVHIGRVERGYLQWRRGNHQIGEWLAAHGRPGASIAIGDIGEVGYLTDYRVIDILGLVTPAIANLPGGYTTKDPERAVDVVLSARPDYIFVISRGRPAAGKVPRAHGRFGRRLVADPRFRRRYRPLLVHRRGLRRYTTVMRNLETTAWPPLDPAIDGDFARRRYRGWKATGAFAPGATVTTHDWLWRLGVWGLEGERCAASAAAPTGALRSRRFTLTGGELRFLVASTAASDRLAVELHVDGGAVLRAPADGSRAAREVRWDVRAWRGRAARLVVRDDDPTPGAFIAADWFRQLP